MERGTVAGVGDCGVEVGSIERRKGRIVGAGFVGGGIATAVF